LGRTRETYQLVHAETGQIIARRVTRAGTAWERVKGLIGRHTLAEDEGLWLSPCNGIHTFGVAFPIDVVVLDKAGQILRVAAALPPRRVLLPVHRGYSVVELAAGAAERAGLGVGDMVRLDVAASPEGLNNKLR
jgi:uncharacterized protein